MKLKASKNDFKNSEVYRIGYCQLQSLLNEKSPFAYSCGVNGWSCDYYQFGSAIISTGYSPIGKEVDYKIVRLYESKAQKLYELPYEKRNAKREKLLNEFIAKIRGLNK